MSPEARLDRVLEALARVEYFRGSAAGRSVAEELETSLVGTPLVVIAELRDKYVRERIPGGPRDLSFIKAMTDLLPEDEVIAVHAGETKNRMRAEGRKEFGLVDAIIFETARAAGATLVTGDPHFQHVEGVRFLS